jgi:hypothetical protein
MLKSDADLVLLGINMAKLKPQVVAKLREKAASYEAYGELRWPSRRGAGDEDTGQEADDSWSSKSLHAIAPLECVRLGCNPAQPYRAGQSNGR